MKVRALAGPEGLAALEDAWRELFDSCPDATPFQSPEWLVPCARHLARGRIAVHAFEQDGLLAGVLPLVVDGAEVRLLGTGVSDYLDLLALPEARADAVSRVPALLPRAGRVALVQLPPDGALAALAEAPGWSVERAPGEPCPVLSLSAEGLETTVPPHQLKKLRQARRQAESRNGEIALADGPVPELLPELFRLHGERWQVRGEEGVLAAAAVQAFHSEAAPRLAARGMLRMRSLALGGERVAVFYGFTRGDRLFSYLSGFAPSVARRSPGLLLLGALMEEAVAQRIRLIDFLRGREPYKYAWGARDRETVSLTLRVHPDLSTPPR